MSRPHRKSLRLTGYDYRTDGIYYLTVCIAGRRPILSCISKKADGGIYYAETVLTNQGKIVERYLHSIPEAYPSVRLLSYVIMPDHLHMILHLCADAETASRADGRVGRPYEHSVPRTVAVGRIVASFKRLTRRASADIVWQTGFYDHIIRSEDDLSIKMDYIQSNPLRYLLKQE